jgi:hypothetical protein
LQPPPGSKPVTFDAFLKVLQRPDGYKTQGSEEEFIQGFQVFDKDGTGFISIGELRYGMFGRCGTGRQSWLQLNGITAFELTIVSHLVMLALT